MAQRNVKREQEGIWHKVHIGTPKGSYWFRTIEINFAKSHSDNKLCRREKANTSYTLYCIQDIMRESFTMTPYSTKGKIISWVSLRYLYLYCMTVGFSTSYLVHSLKWQLLNKYPRTVLQASRWLNQSLKLFNSGAQQSHTVLCPVQVGQVISYTHSSILISEDMSGWGQSVCVLLPHAYASESLCHKTLETTCWAYSSWTKTSDHYVSSWVKGSAYINRWLERLSCLKPVNDSERWGSQRCN